MFHRAEQPLVAGEQLTAQPLPSGLVNVVYQEFPRCYRGYSGLIFGATIARFAVPCLEGQSTVRQSIWMPLRRMGHTTPSETFPMRQ